MRDVTKCPGCGHEMDERFHDSELGCLVGWEWDEHGIATKDGCRCPLTIAGAR